MFIFNLYMDLNAHELLRKGAFPLLNIVSSKTKTLAVLDIIYIYLKQEMLEVLQ